MSHLLSLDDVKVWFGGVKAVDGISLTIEEGKLYGLVGPNGSGKTTLINAISRVTSITSGQITLDGVDVSRKGAFQVGRAGLARTFQGIRLVPGLTVLENVMLGADYRLPHGENASAARPWSRAGQRAITERAREALEHVGMGRHARTVPGQLSYGSQRRVEIARAIAGNPRLLLLDEPVAGMNKTERAEIAEVLLSLKARGVTQLLVEHDLGMVLNLSDHLFVANFGRLIADGDPEEAAARPEVVEAYLGTGRRGNDGTGSSRN